MRRVSGIGMGVQRTLFALGCLLWLLAPSVPLRAAPVMDAIRDLEKAAGGAVRITTSPLTGTATFVAATGGRGIRVAAAARASAAERAKAFVDAHGGAFGVRGAGDLQVIRTDGPDEVGMEHVRMQQMRGGVPVIGAELTVHLRGDAVIAVLGKTLSDLDDLDIAPRLSAAEAVRATRQMLAADLGVQDAALSTPHLEILDRRLLESRGTSPRLAWFMEATRRDRRERVWVDAASGEVLLHFNQLPDALDRRIYDAMGTTAIPGTLMRSEGGAPTGNADVDNVYDYARDTYDYYLNEHGRESFDGTGTTMIATVNSCTCGCPCFNAFWNGSQTIFGDIFATDDLVGHEFTHGVTEYSAGLIYYTWSGALDESYSDIFGETIDLTNGAGTDTPAVRWGFGEDIAPGFIGFRNLMDPTIWSDPGKVSDPQFHCDLSVDGGGVHTNSGIGNHAYALMVDGGVYNGYTNSGIGLTKAGKIEYRALTQYLTPVSDFTDNYNALLQSCADLVGTAGITAADCVQVENALDAVEMSEPWPCSAPQCPAAPVSGCTGTTRSLLLVKRDATDEGRNRLLWKGSVGSVSAGMFGDPTTSAGYALCVYDATGGSPSLVMSARVPAAGTCGDKPCWAATGDDDFKYRNAASNAEGITKVLLKPLSASAKAQVKGRGAKLNTPALPLTPPVTVQLLRGDSPDCWEAAYSAAPVINSATQFKAKSE